MKKFRALSCLVFSLCLVFYAVPRLPVEGTAELASSFSLVWTLFAMLVIGSNLLFVVGADQSGLERRRRPVDFRKQKRLPSQVRKRRVSIDI